MLFTEVEPKNSLRSARPLGDGRSVGHVHLGQAIWLVYPSRMVFIEREVFEVLAVRPDEGNHVHRGRLRNTVYPQLLEKPMRSAADVLNLFEGLGGGSSTYLGCGAKDVPRDHDIPKWVHPFSSSVSCWYCYAHVLCVSTW